MIVLCLIAALLAASVGFAIAGARHDGIFGGLAEFGVALICFAAAVGTGVGYLLA